MQRTYRFIGLLLATGFACGPAPDTSPVSPEGVHPDLYRNDTDPSDGFRRNPNFLVETPTFAVKRSKLSLEGEIIVVEGDAQTVSQNGISMFGISEDNQRAIVAEVLAAVPDEFDTIQIYTTFTDQMHAGFAYYTGIRQQVQGLGKMTYNNRPAWGLPANEGRLSGFSNMNSMLMWGNGNFDGLNAVEGFYHGVIAHELSHRWLFNMRFKDNNGMTNFSLLGRDDAHWSRLAQAYGSVHDGNFFVENVGSDTFTNMGTDLGFAPLDLYAMGRLAADEVEDFYYLVDARDAAGDPLNKLSGIAAGATIEGNKIDVTMDMIIDEMGPRDPPPLVELPYYRAAFVLVTSPGEARTSWEPHLTNLQQIAEDFPTTWQNWTGGAMCTKVTERCPEPVIDLGGFRVEEDGDGIIAPGETFSVVLSAQNVGIGTAEGVTVELASRFETAMVSTGVQNAPPLPAGEVVEIGTPFMVTASSTIACDLALSLEARFTTPQGPIFRERIEIDVGSRQLRFDPLNESPDWRVNPDGDDSATTGVWELGEPEEGGAAGVLTQPGSDHTPGEAKLAFFTGPELRDFFASNDVDNGKTTLESPIFALSIAEDPSLVFYAWRVGIDFSQQNGPTDLTDSPLTVFASNDGGETYRELGAFNENTEDWTRVSFRIRDAVEVTDRMRFRFVIEDSTAAGTVEAGIDDVAIVDFLETCSNRMPEPRDGGVVIPSGGGDDDSGGCGCSNADTDRGPTGAAAVLLFGIVGALFFRRD